MSAGDELSGVTRAPGENDRSYAKRERAFRSAKKLYSQTGGNMSESKQKLVVNKILKEFISKI